MIYSVRMASVLASFAGTAILDTTPTTIHSIIARATPQQMAWRPNQDRWSIAMVLAHLADVEVNGFRQRFRALTEENDPFLPSYDQHKLFQTTHRFDGWTDLDSFARERAQTVELLRGLPAEVLDRRGRHEELRAGISFGELLNEMAFHDLGHIRQIAELYRAAAFYPNMGPFCTYYTINP